MSPEMSSAINEARKAKDLLDLNDPNYPPARVDSMSEEDCRAIIEDGWIATSPEEIDLPIKYTQSIIEGPVFTRRREDLEKKFKSPPTVMEIRQARRVIIVVIADESLPCGEVEFEAYDHNKHPDIDSIQIFDATPAETVNLLKLADAFSDTEGSASKLEDTRKKGASRRISNTANI